MKKVRMRRKPGNVYHSPIAQPVSIHTQQRIDPRTGEILGTHEMTETENVQQWYDIFREMGRETVEIQRRERRQNRHNRQRGEHRSHGNQKTQTQ